MRATGNGDDEQAAPETAARDTGHGSVPETPDHDDHRSRAGVSKRRILLIAEDAAGAASLAQRLDNLGFGTAVAPASPPVATTVIEAVTADPSAAVDAIIIDVITPQTRAAALERLAGGGYGRDPTLARAPRIFLSARGDFDVRLDAVRHGAACFLVKPIDVIELAGTLQRLTQHQREAPLRVMVVSGNRDTTGLLAEPLTDVGFEVCEMTDPGQTVSVLGGFQPDVLVIDHGLAGCAAHELAAVVRQLSILHARVPIVFITGEHSAIGELLATRAAGDDLLRQPVDLMMLRSSVQARARRFRDITALARRHRANEERLRALTYSAGDAVLSIDDGGMITYWNPAAERMFGYPAEETIGGPLTRMMPERFRIPHLAGLRRLIAAADPSSYLGSVLELTGLHRDGTEFPIEVSISRWSDGDRVAFSGLIRDITRRRQLELQLEHSRARFQDFAEVSSDYFWETDVTSRFTYFSGRFEELFGIPMAQALGQRRHELWVANRCDQIDHNLEALAEIDAAEAARRPYDQARIAWLHPDGRLLYLSVSGRPVFQANGSWTGYRGVGVDVTETVVAERAIHAARDDAERANRAKSEFLSAMSHELRTPLNSIIGFSELLQTISDPPLHGKPLSYVDYILKASHHLLELINEILDLAKIETGRFTFDIDSIIPKDLAEDCITIVKPLAHERHIDIINEVETPPGTLVQADYRRCRQALLNFLSNAVKYNHDGGWIRMSVRLAGPSRCRFSVQDNGIGIPRAKQDRLFEPFNRLGAESLGVEGTGIGLALTRRLVETMGGAIGFASEEDQGSLFWFELPVATPATTGEPRTPQTSLMTTIE